MSDIEILLATYNGGSYIGAQIESILAQTNQEWHLTVSDDGSSDDTVQLVDGYCRAYPDRIRRVVSGQRFGNARDHFFWLLSQSKAEHIFFCDQDDVWQPDKVELSLKKLRELEDTWGPDCPAMVFSDLSVVDEQLQPVHGSLMYMQQQDPEIRDYRQLLFKNVVNGNTQAINRSLACLALECTDQTGVLMHDWWAAIIAARFGKIAYLPRQTVLYRQHGDNDVGAVDERKPAFYLNKLLHPDRMLNTFQKKARQADVFLHTFADRLDPEEQKILACYAGRKMPLPMKWDYLQWLNGFSRKLGFFLLW